MLQVKQVQKMARKAFIFPLDLLEGLTEVLEREHIAVNNLVC